MNNEFIITVAVLIVTLLSMRILLGIGSLIKAKKELTKKAVEESEHALNYVGFDNIINNTASLFVLITSMIDHEVSSHLMSYSILQQPYNILNLAEDVKNIAESVFNGLDHDVISDNDEIAVNDAYIMKFISSQTSFKFTSMVKQLNLTVRMIKKDE